MNKLGKIVVVTIAVFILYLLMLVVMPFFSDMASTANTTMAASSNLTNYPGGAEGVLAAPLILWFVPGAIGMVVVVIILRQP